MKTLKMFLFVAFFSFICDCSTVSYFVDNLLGSGTSCVEESPCADLNLAISKTSANIQGDDIISIQPNMANNYTVTGFQFERVARLTLTSENSLKPSLKLNGTLLNSYVLRITRGTIAFCHFVMVSGTHFAWLAGDIDLATVNIEDCSFLSLNMHEKYFYVELYSSLNILSSSWEQKFPSPGSLASSFIYYNPTDSGNVKVKLEKFIVQNIIYSSSNALIVHCGGVITSCQVEDCVFGINITVTDSSDPPRTSRQGALFSLNANLKTSPSDTDIKFDNCTFTSIEHHFDGVISIYNPPPLATIIRNFDIVKSSFIKIKGFKGVGAVSIENAFFDIIDCNFINNINQATAAAGFGGALYIRSVIHIHSTTVYSNISGSQFFSNNALNGGAIFTDGTYFLTRNSFFSDNIGTVGGNDIYSDSGSDADINDFTTGSFPQSYSASCSLQFVFVFLSKSNLIELVSSCTDNRPVPFRELDKCRGCLVGSQTLSCYTQGNQCVTQCHGYTGNSLTYTCKICEERVPDEGNNPWPCRLTSSTDADLCYMLSYSPPSGATQKRCVSACNPTQTASITDGTCEALPCEQRSVVDNPLNVPWPCGLGCWYHPLEGCHTSCSYPNLYTSETADTGRCVLKPCNIRTFQNSSTALNSAFRNDTCGSGTAGVGDDCFYDASYGESGGCVEGTQCTNRLHYYADRAAGQCKLKPCAARTPTNDPFPCGTETGEENPSTTTCFKDNGAGEPLKCRASGCSYEEHYEAIPTTGMCVLKSCSQRTANESVERPCGGPGCVADPYVSPSACVPIQCTNTAHYEVKAARCTLKETCSERTKNEAAALWCGDDCVYYQPYCDVECPPHHVPNIAGNCELQSCAERTPHDADNPDSPCSALGDTVTCIRDTPGDSDLCVLQLLQTDNPCTHREHYTPNTARTHCVLKDCIDRTNNHCTATSDPDACEACGPARRIPPGTVYPCLVDTGSGTPDACTEGMYSSLTGEYYGCTNGNHYKWDENKTPPYSHTDNGRDGTIVCELKPCEERTRNDTIDNPCGKNYATEFGRCFFDPLRATGDSCASTCLVDSHYFPNPSSGSCDLKPCGQRSVVLTGFPCGEYTCIHDPNDIGNGRPTCKVASEGCVNPQHYEVGLNGQCQLKNCAARQKNASTNPCGGGISNPNCVGDTNVGPDVCNVACSNPVHYPTIVNGLCEIVPCASRVSNNSVSDPCGKGSGCILDPINININSTLCVQKSGTVNIDTMCSINGHRVYNSDTGRCELRPCASRSPNISQPFPCGEVSCHHDPVGGGLINPGPGSSGTCINANQECARLEHYQKSLSSTGRCELRPCGDRKVVSVEGMTYPCGSNDCYADAGHGPATCNLSCTNPLHYTSNAASGTCVLNTCENRRTNGSLTDPCGKGTTCFLDPNNENKCVSTCAISQHFEGSLSSGVCSLRPCSTRTKLATQLYPCGDTTCFADRSDASPDCHPYNPVTNLCFHPELYAQNFVTGWCDLKPCAQRTVWTADPDHPENDDDNNNNNDTDDNSTNKADLGCGGDAGCYRDNGAAAAAGTGRKANTCNLTCSNAAHYDADDTTHECVLKECEQRNSNGSLIDPCGKTGDIPCFLDPNRGSVCTAECSVSAHYTSSSTTGTCVLKPCSQREANTTEQYHCGDRTCILHLINQSCQPQAVAPAPPCPQFQYLDVEHAICLGQPCAARTPDPVSGTCLSPLDSTDAELRCGLLPAHATADPSGTLFQVPAHCTLPTDSTDLSAHYVNTNGIYTLKDCTDRVRNDSTQYKCGSADCFWDAGAGATSTKCIAKGSACTHGDYIQDTLTGNCVDANTLAGAVIERTVKSKTNKGLLAAFIVFLVLFILACLIGAAIVLYLCWKARKASTVEGGEDSSSSSRALSSTSVAAGGPSPSKEQQQRDRDRDRERRARLRAKESERARERERERAERIDHERSISIRGGDSSIGSNERGFVFDQDYVQDYDDGGYNQDYIDQYHQPRMRSRSQSRSPPRMGGGGGNRGRQMSQMAYTTQVSRRQYGGYGRRGSGGYGGGYYNEVSPADSPHRNRRVQQMEVEEAGYADEEGGGDEGEMSRSTKEAPLSQRLKDSLKANEEYYSTNTKQTHTYTVPVTDSTSTGTGTDFEKDDGSVGQASQLTYSYVRVPVKRTVVTKKTTVTTSGTGSDADISVGLEGAAEQIEAVHTKTTTVTTNDGTTTATTVTDYDTGGKKKRKSKKKLSDVIDQ